MASPWSDLAEVWRERLNAARLRYQGARDHATEELQKWNPGEVPFPDGGFALRTATKTETEAVREYMRVLRIFNDLAVHGKKPPEE